MNGYKISISDYESMGRDWEIPAPFEISTTTANLGQWDAPVAVNLLAGTHPARAAALLREVADALDRNGWKWLPDLVHDFDRTDGELQNHLDSLAQDPYGHMAEVVAFEDGEHYPEVLSVCNYRDKTPRREHSPTVRLEITCGTPPREVLALLTCITASVKASIKKDGAAAFKPVNQSADSMGNDSDEVPF